ncbi:hemagglutinin repeat-containing protein [Vulcaniibacterium tengchongense]|uniref:hemagglutinin repeat-containing protein n=1 Tax=Vulcaniibacterium tengchongense TaxID=1273429 RepID=UPI0011CB1DB8|nr:hemagglutinin repeat-containing protein [Vulcaniibacterium tengchongense]
MNRIYRLVFNRALGVLQVASELVRSPRGSGTNAEGAAVACLRPVSFALWLALGWVGLATPIFAQQVQGRIVADPEAPGKQRPTVLSAANGVPLVNIATPSAAGVSRNTYSQFDVGPEGAILNNSRGNVQTQLGGWVQGNPWLARGTAKVILNEVNSSDPSRLHGYVEVAGDRAAVVIANPAGIQVNGGGFLNASRVTLTTGKPVFAGGALDHYRVEGGAIQVDGAGLDATQADYTDLIARSLQVNAGIWAEQLQASLGANIVGGDHAQVTATPAGAGPAFALDVGALGGMYAGKIALLGTEHGVGVRNAGTIGAQAGELRVTVDGRLENTGALQSQQDARIAASGGVANAGTLSAARELIVSTPADVDNRGGTLNAQRIEVDAASLRNGGGAIEQTGLQALALRSGFVSNRDGGRIGMAEPTPNPGSGGNPGPGAGGGTGDGGGAGSGGQPGNGVGSVPLPQPLADGALRIAGTLDNDGGRINAGGGVALSTANGLDNGGGHLGLRELTLTRGDLGNAGGELNVAGDARLTVGRIANDGGRLEVAGALQVDAQSLSNRGGTVSQGGTAASAIKVAGTFDNTGGTLASNASSLTLGSGVLANEEGRIEHAGMGGLTVRADTLQGAGGTIAAHGDVHLGVSQADHRGASLSAARVGLEAERFDNRGGRIVATGPDASTLAVRDTFDNGDRGAIASQGDLSIQASTLANAGGTVQLAGTGTLAIDAAALKGEGGTLASNGALTIVGGTLDLRAGTTFAQKVAIDADTVTTAGGTLTAAGAEALMLRARARLDNTVGRIATNGALQLEAGALANGNGSITAAGAGDTRVAVSGAFDNSRGVLAAAGATTIEAGEITNAAGVLQAAGAAALQVRAHGLLANSDAGTITASGDLTVAAAKLDNIAGTIAHAGDGTLRITASALDGADGSIASNGALALSGGALNLRGGTTSARTIGIDAVDLITAEGVVNAAGTGEMSVRIGRLFDNTAGSVATNGVLRLDANSLSNVDGILSAAGTGASSVVVGGEFDNSRGLLVGSGILDVAAGELINRDTRSAGSDAALKGGIYGEQVNLTAGVLDNAAGRIAAREMLTLSAEAFGNAAGEVAAGSALAIDAVRLNGENGTLATNGTLALAGDRTDLRGGTTSARRILVDTGELITAGGTLTAAGTDALDLRVRGMLDNTAGRIATNGALQLQAGALTNARGSVTAAGNQATTLSVAGALDNTRGTLATAGATTVRAGELVNAEGVLQASSEAPLVVGVDGRLSNQRGTIESNGAIELTARVLGNRDGVVRTQRGIDIAASDELDNAGGTVVAGGDLALKAGTLLNRDTFDASAADPASLRGLFGAKVTLEAGTIDNATGRISAEDSLTLSGTTLRNAGGSIDGRGAVSVTAASFDNAGGELVQRGEAGVLALTVSGALANTADGLIGAEGAANVQAGTLDNRGGTVFARNGLAVSSRGDMRNGDGGLLRSGAGLTLNSGGLFDNSHGAVDATGTATLSADRIANVAGQILAGTAGDASAALSVAAAGAVDNRGGTIGSRGGDLALRAAQVENSGAGTLVAHRDLALDAAAMNNASGTTYATRHLRYETAAGVLDNAGGRFGAGDTAWLNLARIGNGSGGRIQAGTLWLTVPVLDTSGGEIGADRLHAQIATLTGTGRLFGAQWLNLAFSGDFVHQDGLRLESNGSLGLTVSGTFTNQGTLQSASELVINAANLVNHGTINASNAAGTGVNRITVGGAIDNRVGASIEGDAVALAARDVSNTGDIVGDTVRIEADTLTNGRDLGSALATRDYGEGFIGAAELLELNIGQSLRNLDAEIFSAGDLSVAGRNGGRLGELRNVSGRIQAEGDAYVAADRIENARRVLEYTWGALTPEQQAALTLSSYGSDAETYGAAFSKLFGRYCSTNCMYFNLEYVEKITPTEGIFVTRASKESVLAAGSDLSLNTASLLNRYSAIAAGRNLTINGEAGGEATPGVNNVSLSGQQSWQVTGEYYLDYQACNAPSGVTCEFEPKSAGGTMHFGAVTRTTYPVEGRATVTAGGALTIVTDGDVGNAIVRAADGLSGVNSGSLGGPGNTGLGVSTRRQAGTTGGVGTVGGRQVDVAQASRLALHDKVNGAGNPANAAPQTVGTPDRPLPGLVPPDNGMFDLVADPNAPFLVKTAPRFVKGEAAGSDLLLSTLGYSETAAHKRLGDAYYEQRLVLEQILALTGRRSLSGHGDGFAQYRALMDNAAAVAGRLGLALGAPLTNTQIGALDQDIVWLVEQEVAGQKVLVPVVYLSRATAERLRAEGALIAGDTVDVQSGATVRNDGTIASDRGTWLSADALINDGAIRGGGRVDLATRGDTINRGKLVGGTVAIDAGGDVINAPTFDGLAWRGGTIAADSVLQVSAGRDVINQGTLSSGGHAIVQAGRDFVQNASVAQAPVGHLTAGGSAVVTAGRDLVLDRSAVTAGGHVALDAGRDARFTASEVGAGGGIAVTAGRDIVSDTVTETVTSTTQTYRRQGKKRTWTTTTVTDETVTGSTFQAGGDIAMVAGQDITLTAAAVRSDEGGIAVAAGRDLTLNTAQETDHLVEDSVSKKKNTFSKTTTRSHSEVTDSYAIGTTLSGERVDLSAGNDLRLQAAMVAGDHGVTLAAGHDIRIETGVNTHTESHSSTKKKSGLFSGGGVGVTVGTQRITQTADITEVSNTGSLIGSSDGRVDIVAGNDVTITGSDVLSKAGIGISGENVTIQAAENTVSVLETQKFKQSGLNVSLKGGAVDVATSVAHSVQRGAEVEDDRLKALYAAQAGQTLFSNNAAGLNALQNIGTQANQGIADAANGTRGGNAGLSLRIGLGASSSSSRMEYEASTAQGSRIASEGEVAIVARSGDLSVIGSRVEGDNVALAAAQDLILKSATETTEQRERNKASSGAIGVTVGSEAGIGVYVSASTAKGQGQGSGTTHAETTVQAGNTLTLISGRDTTLEGAQALGERVIADVGRNLSLISQQDTNDYRRKDQAGGIDAAVGTGGGQVSGYYNQQKIDSTYTRVREQTGIQAGAGGFDIRVGGHTELVGAAIASTADPSRNRLDTGSLSVGDLQNEVSYQASSVGGGFGSGGSAGNALSNGIGAGLNLAVGQSGDASSTTRSGISAGTIEIRDGDTAALASLDRSVTQLQQEGLQAIFDERKVQERLEMGQVAGQVGMRTAGAWPTRWAGKRAARRRRSCTAWWALASPRWEVARPCRV